MNTTIIVRSNLDGFRAEHVNGQWLQCDHKGTPIRGPEFGSGVIRDLLEAAVIDRIAHDVQF